MRQNGVSHRARADEVLLRDVIDGEFHPDDNGARWAVGITPWGEGNAHGTTRHDARPVQGSNIGVLF